MVFSFLLPLVNFFCFLCDLYFLSWKRCVYSASSDGDDEEWGWGDDNGNGDINNDDVNDLGDDGWGDDDGDWGEDSSDIEMTTPAFSGSNGGYNDKNMTQRRPSFDSDKMEAAVIAPLRNTAVLPSKPPKPTPLKPSSFHAESMSRNSSGNSVSSSSGVATGMSLTTDGIGGGASRGIPMAPRSGPSAIFASSSLTPPASTMTTITPPLVTASTFATTIPTTVGGMAMGITSLGPKKKPTVAAKPKKKTLMGATDDDIFASMGFGGPSSMSAKTKTATNIATTTTTKVAGGSRWATSQTTPPPTTAASPFGSNSALPATKPLATAAIETTSLGLGGFSSTSAVSATKTRIPAAPKTAVASIPDGFGDEDDLDLDLDGGDAVANAEENWGDDDGDLDDLLFD